MRVIGTAGHVDHGKSTLVRALTGIDPDRLAEEKAREMTIDLGFAWMTLDGEEIGIVDVPGHRDFIENMLAGVGGIDLALFVVAADEGVMPQTREHLAILDLLEVHRGIIALTKTDLIDDPDWLELVTLEVGEIVRGTSLAAAPIVPVSAHSGAGLEILKNEISRSLREIDRRINTGRPRLPIDRVFTLPGFGTVVTGTLLDGYLRLGDEVTIQPGAFSGRIRGLQTHKMKREEASPGSRVAINLTGIPRDELRRGQVVSISGQLRATQLVDAHYRHLADADAPLLHNVEVKVFTGASEALARTRIIGGEYIKAGEEGWLQLSLSEPIAVVRGDHFILRRPSPGATIGGGIVLDPHPGRRHRRFRADVTERYQALAKGSPEELIMRNLIQLGPVQTRTLREKTGLTDGQFQPSLQAMMTEGQIVGIGQLLVASSIWNELKRRIPADLAVYHKDEPLRSGMDRESLRGRLKLPAPLFAALCESLAGEGLIIQERASLRLPQHRVQFSPEQESAVAQLMALFEDQGVQSPSVKESKAVVGEAVYYALVDQGRIKPIAEDVVYSTAIYNRLIEQLSDFLYEHGSITAAEARDLLNASRKYAIALLEHMDELRITRRSGDTRLPVRPPSTGP